MAQRRRVRGATLVAASVLSCSVAAQHTAMELQTVDLATTVADKRGEQVPGDLSFVDEMRRTVKLSDYFGHERPIILNLGYFGCPAMCGAVTNGMVQGLLELDLEIGQDFDVITVSIDPKEAPSLAREKKNSYLARYTAAAAEQHWHFLTGKEDQIKALADAVGFGYQWNPHGKQYDHSPALMVLSPEGTLSQVLHGVVYDGRTMRFALVEASDGRVGTTWDRILLTCYGYDPQTQEYSLLVWTVVRISGVLTVLGIAAMIFVLWRRERQGAAAAAA